MVLRRNTFNTFVKKYYDVSGKIDQCCCEGYALKDTNNKITPIINRLSVRFCSFLCSKAKKSEFFRYFKVDLEKECPFWAVELICTSPETCGVHECDDNQVTSIF